MYTQRFKIAFERLMRKKITNSVVSKLSPAPDKRQVIIYDTEVAGFGVRAMASGVKTFIFYKRPKNTTSAVQITIARCTEMNVEEARDRARKLAIDYRSGDYLKKISTDRAIPTLLEAIFQYDALELSQKRPRYRQETLGYLNRHVVPTLGKLKLNDITRKHVASVVEKFIKSGQHATAKSVWGAVSTLLSFAMRFGYVESNVILNHPPKFRTAARNRFLQLNELRAIWLATDGISSLHRSAVRMLILLPLRKNELLNLRWSDIDEKWLTVPGERTKNGDELSLYLTDFLATSFPPKRSGTDLLFSTNGKSPMVLGSKVKRKLLENFTIPQWQYHDFRRTFSTHMHETSQDSIAIEACLNHRDPTRRGVAGVYNRAQYKARKQAILQGWSDIVEEEVNG